VKHKRIAHRVRTLHGFGGEEDVEALQESVERPLSEHGCFVFWVVEGITGLEKMREKLSDASNRRCKKLG
jgi:hypothetical protein